MTNEITHQEAPIVRAGTAEEYEVSDVLAQVHKIQTIMQQVMKRDEHYGLIPGCGDKPTLLKAGAEKIGFTFRLMPRFIVERVDYNSGHREYSVTCELYHVISGAFVGAGVGTCSTMEAKYRFRSEDTGRPVPKEYWESRDPALLGGPQFRPRKKDGNWTIYQQVEHDNPADYYNTVLKMGKKRAHVDAILTATAASDIFTQDLEELRENGVIGAQETRKAAPANHAAPPQRKSANGNGTSNGSHASVEELSQMCADIASAGYTVTTKNHKDFALAPTSEMETGDSICIKLSSFVGRDKGVVPGKTPEGLSEKAMQITHSKAKSAWEALQKVLSTNQDSGDDGVPWDGPTEETSYECQRCGVKFDTMPESGKCKCLGAVVEVQTA